MKTQQCSKCGVVKELTPENFYRNKQSKHGFRPDCKSCRNKVNNAWGSKPEVAQRKRDASQKWREENREQHLRQCREWSRNNREYRNNYAKERHKDPTIKLRKNVSNVIYNTLTRENSDKQGRSTWTHLPYTPQQLREHIESQFDGSMTWDNYGSHWHIDHIYPQSRLPYDSMEHPNFLLCWSLDNLRPLSATENLKKSNKILDNHPQTHYITNTTTNHGDNMKMLSEGTLQPAPVEEETPNNEGEQ